MKKIAYSFVLFLFLPLVAVLASASKNPAKVSYKPGEVRKIMEKVADWQLNEWKTTLKYPLWDWVNGAGYTGVLSLSDISKNKKYSNSLIEIADKINWNMGPNRFFADDYCVGQTYSILYSRYKDPKMIANWQKLADSILVRPHDESLAFINKVHHREWAWCDALFMGPPSLAYLSTATGDRKYLDLALKLWWKTTDYLYDPEEHLYYRDSRFFDKREKNGQKVFWSRGNGWVIAGLVRMLENMPEGNPERKKLENLYKEMAVKIISLQQADGSWHSSLLDPKSYDIKETSGTGFYCYALLWGMNHGLLDKKANWPVVKKAWESLVSSVQADGKLGYVQPIGAAPDKVDQNTTEAYGVGAFLLTGSQLYKFLSENKGLI